MAWPGRIRWAYHCGIFALLTGLALALAPPLGPGAEVVFRRVAFCITTVVLAAQLIWPLRPISRLLHAPADDERQQEV
jgi:hypothetical protein